MDGIPNILHLEAQIITLGFYFIYLMLLFIILELSVRRSPIIIILIWFENIYGFLTI